MSKMGFPSFVNDLNSVPIEGVLSNDAYSLRFNVDAEEPLALSVKPPTACFKDSIVCVVVLLPVPVATGAMIVISGREVVVFRMGW